MFILLFLLISFGSVCAVMFTPALPQIGAFFGVSPSVAQITITLYLVGYAFGQLLYGPLGNAYGHKKTLYIGISLEIISALFCVLSASVHAFWVLAVARLFLALGASVGLKMSFSLIPDYYSQDEAPKIVSHLMMAFAITPGLSVALGGFLSEHFHWTASFYFLIFYGMFLFYLVSHMRDVPYAVDTEALKINKIVSSYARMLKNSSLVSNAFLMGSAPAFVYLFAAIAPFLTSTFMHLSPAQYGLWNLLPLVGIVTGSQLAAYGANRVHPRQAILIGAVLAALGVGVMLGAFMLKFVMPIFLFLPTTITYVGLTFIMSNASMLAMQSVEDKSSGSAMMNFINVGTAMLGVVGIGMLHSTSHFLLPVVYSIVVVLLFLVIFFTRTRVASTDH